MTRDHRAMAAGLVDVFLGARLEAAGEPAGLRQAAVELAAVAFASEDFEQLMKHQLQQLRSPNSNAVPDAYLADEAAVEDALQRAAAGLRVAAAQNGRLLDAQSFERSAMLRLHADPRQAVRAELARVPRPATRPNALRWSLEPAPWAADRDDDAGWPPTGLEAVAPLRYLPGGASTLASVEGGPHDGWVQIGLIERHLTPPRRYPDRPTRQVLICLGLEIGDTEPPSRSLPFVSSPWQVWVAPWHRLDPSTNPDAATQQLSTLNSSVVALADVDHRRARWREVGLGKPAFLLAPILPIVVAFGLEPTKGVCGFSLSDDRGPGLIMRTWRAHLVHDGNYDPLQPAVDGADLLVRPDLVAQLLDVVGEARTRTGHSVSRRAGEDEGKDD